MISVLEYRKLAKGFIDTYAINETGYWWKREIPNIYSVSWTFSEGDHLMRWWYPPYLADNGDVWTLLNGNWHLNIVTGESNGTADFDTSKYVNAFSDNTNSVYVTPDKFKAVMGKDFPSNKTEGWGRSVMEALEEYRVKASKRRYL